MYVCCCSRCSCIQRNHSIGNLVEHVDEIEHFFLERRQNLLQVMHDPVDNMPLKDYEIPTKEDPYCSIVHPPVADNNFELKPYLIRIVQQNQFSSLPYEIQIFKFLCLSINYVLLRIMALIKCYLPPFVSLFFKRPCTSLDSILVHQFYYFPDPIESGLYYAVLSAK